MKNMTRKTVKFFVVLVLIIVGPTLMVTAKDKIEKVLVAQKYTVNKDAVLEIDHKYGEINCKNWNEQAISVKVIASVETSDPDKAKKYFDRIHVTVEGNRDEVSVTSDISERLFENGNNNLSIDIEIFMPKSIQLVVEHQFGSAYFESVTGNADISSEYGNLEVKSLEGEENSIEVGFGKATLGYLKQGDLEISYSTLELGESVHLSIESDYSTLEVDKAEVIEIENEGGSTTIGEVQKIEISSRFSDVEVKDAGKSLRIENEYGGFTVRNIRKGFSKVDLSNSFGSVKMTFENGASFNLNADMEYCTLEYPNSLSDFRKKIVSGGSSTYEGKMGNGDASGSLVEISSEYGGVEIVIK